MESVRTPLGGREFRFVNLYAQLLVIVQSAVRRARAKRFLACRKRFSRITSNDMERITDERPGF